MNREVLINSLEEFMEETDARLTALEGDKPQGTLTSPDWCRIAGERLTEIEHLTAENKQLASERKTLSSVWHALKIDNERLAAEVERLAYDNANLEAGKSYWLNGSDTLLRRLNALEEQRNALAAQVDDLRNVNADQQELIAALRQNSADLVVSIQLLQAEAEPRKDNERTAVLESLQDENATLRSRLAATKRQADEIKRLEAVCDDLSDKLDAANATPNHTDSEKLAFARNEIDALEAQRNMLAAQVDDLRNVNAGLRAALGTAADKIRRLTEGFYALEAQRNALAAQVDDLRNVNAALRIALSDPAPCTGTGSGGCDCLPDDEA